jgi:hypothetical protein
MSARRLTLIVIALGWVIAACNPGDANAYDTDPQTVVIYADLEINNGAPYEGQICRFSSVPVLRIWGDGLAFLRMAYIEPGTSDQRYEGTLTAQEVEELVDHLDDQGFFGDWTPEMASPAVNYLHVGANLATQSKEHLFSSVRPQFYEELIDRLKPGLTPFAQGEKVEPRIDRLNSRRECTTPSPAQ